MCGLMKDIDLSFLNRREVIQVAIGAYQVSFGFDKDTAISVYAHFIYFDGNCETEWKLEPNSEQIAARTVALLGAFIERVERHEDGRLTVLFSNGDRLTFLDSTKDHESYDITRPGQTIVA
jgi:hypothetical protein